MMQKITVGLYRLSMLGMFNAYLVETNDGLMLIDTGNRWQAGSILRDANRLAANGGALQNIVITHGHSDHTGGAAIIQRETGASIWMHPGDAGALTSGAGNGFFLSGSQRGLTAGQVEPAEVTGELVDGASLAFAPDWLVVHTPGHTPGQCCFLNQALGVLITGDAVMRWFGRLSAPFSLATIDMDRNMASVKRLVEYDFEIALFGHGPPILAGARNRLANWLEKRAS